MSNSTTRPLESFVTIPSEMRYHIGNCIQPSTLTEEAVKNCGRIFVDLSLISKLCKDDFSSQLTKLKNIHLFITTFTEFNSEYEDEVKFKWASEGTYEFHPGWNPQLLDIVSAGCAHSSQREFTPVLEELIPVLLKLTPESLSCNLGRMRCRDMITPLSMACLNEQVSVHVIELLLKSGAHPNEATYRINGGGPYRHVLFDMEHFCKGENPSKEWKARTKAIETLFIQYGMDEKHTLKREQNV